MSLPLLLDTCACIYIVDGSIQPATEKILTGYFDRGEAIFVSPFTAWELSMLTAKGRIRLPMSVDDTFEALVTRSGFALAPLTPKILIESCRLPEIGHLNDPVDRIFAATARVCGYGIMTRDRPLLDYARQGHIRALPC